MQHLNRSKHQENDLLDLVCGFQTPPDVFWTWWEGIHTQAVVRFVLYVEMATVVPLNESLHGDTVGYRSVWSLVTRFAVYK